MMSFEKITVQVQNHKISRLLSLQPSFALLPNLKVKTHLNLLAVKRIFEILTIVHPFQADLQKWRFDRNVDRPDYLQFPDHP